MHKCGKCGGTGLLVRWMYNLTGGTIILSFVDILLFLGLFVLSYLGSAFYLSFNEWVYEVDDMGFWFNPSFITWLFAKHRDRWVKWQTGINLFGAFWLGLLIFVYISLNQITTEIFAFSILLSIVIVSLFSWLFYKSYTSQSP